MLPAQSFDRDPVSKAKEKIRNGGDHIGNDTTGREGLGDLIAGPRAVAGSAQDGCPYVATPAALVWRERLGFRVQDERLGAR
jgi:hypothetical protein